MNTVVINCFRRPFTTRLCIEAVMRAQKWYPWADNIAMCLNPGATPEVIRTTREMQLGYRWIEPWRIPGTIGVALRPDESAKWCLDEAFLHGADAVLYVEDDAIISPDSFVLLDWLQEDLKAPIVPTITGGGLLNSAGNRVIGVCLYHETIPANYPADAPPDPRILHLTNGLNTCGGTLFLRDPYLKFIQPRWNCKQREPKGFDFSIHYLMYLHELYMLFPDLSRSHNIGFFDGALGMDHWKRHFARSIWTGEHNGVRDWSQLRLSDTPGGRILEPWMAEELKFEGRG
jgi:hypothetical protein